MLNFQRHVNLVFLKRSQTENISLNRLTEAPAVFLAFAMGETASPERSIGECGGGKTSPQGKSLRKQGAEVHKR
jgi:hypothetical protein